MNNAYQFEREGGGMGRVWYRARLPDGRYERFEYVTPQHLGSYFRGISNYNDADWQSEIVDMLHVLKSCCQNAIITQEWVNAFNEWRQTEHVKFVAKLRADPERYGFIADNDPILAPPPVYGGANWNRQEGRFIHLSPQLEMA